MSLTFNIPFLSLFLALLSAVVCPLLKKGEHALTLVRAVQALVAALSALLLAQLARTGEDFTFMMGHFPAPWGNELRAGPLEALLALVFSLVMLLSLTGGAADIRRDVAPHRQGRYCLLMQLLYAALLAMVYTNDLFTGYVFIEITAITACIAVAAKDSGHAIAAAIRYLVFNSMGSGLVLLGISILYCITGHLLMEPLGEAVARLASEGRYALPLTASILLMTAGLAIKSAQFPFHSWLPDAHSSATTASSAILSALVLKGYIVLLLKLEVRVFGQVQPLMSSSRVNDLLFLLGLAGMVFASLAALRQEDVKRMAAYSSVAQISYIYLAFGLDVRAGLAAGCFQILAHAFTKSMIFVGAGGLIRAGTGSHYWHGLRGAARRDPASGLAFTVGGLSLCGLPLLAGFSAKYGIAAAALDAAGWRTAPALLALAVSSVLNALYYVPAILAIWGRPTEVLPPLPAGGQGERRAAVACLLCANVFLGVMMGPVMDLIRLGLSLF